MTRTEFPGHPGDPRAKTLRNGTKVTILAGTFAGQTGRVVRLPGDDTREVVKVEINGDYYDFARSQLSR